MPGVIANKDSTQPEAAVRIQSTLVQPEVTAPECPGRWGKIL